MRRSCAGYIVYSDVESAFEKLGMSFSKEEISQVFEESDMLENGKLTFKEFLVCLAIGFVLHVRRAVSSPLLEVLRCYAPLMPVPLASRRRSRPSRASVSASSTRHCELQTPIAWHKLMCPRAVDSRCLY